MGNNFLGFNRLLCRINLLRHESSVCLQNDTLQNFQLRSGCISTFDNRIVETGKCLRRVLSAVRGFPEIRKHGLQFLRSCGYCATLVSEGSAKRHHRIVQCVLRVDGAKSRFHDFIECVFLSVLNLLGCFFRSVPKNCLLKCGLLQHLNHIVAKRVVIVKSVSTSLLCKTNHVYFVGKEFWVLLLQLRGKLLKSRRKPLGNRFGGSGISTSHRICPLGNVKTGVLERYGQPGVLYDLQKRSN